MNEIANKAAYYARIAQYASDGFSQVYLGAKDVAPTTDNNGNPLIVGALYFNTVSDILYVWNGSSWTAIDDEEFYLGGFSVAPTVNNQGLPLQTGNLYWNTVSNNLWAYNGTTWVRTNFNETTAFTATGTTTARNLVTRASDIYNVKDFGAIGDGVTNCQTAFQAAINAALSAGGGTIYIPQGTYNFPNTSNAGKLDPGLGNLTFKGDGYTSSILKYWEGTGIDQEGNLFRNLSNDPLKKALIFDSIQIQGSLATRSGRWGNPLYCDYYPEILITNCKFFNIAAMASDFHYCKSVKCINSQFENIAADGIRARDCFDFIVTGNKFTRIGDDAIANHTADYSLSTFIPQRERIIISNNTIVNGQQFVRCIAAKKTIITGNTIHLAGGIDLRSNFQSPPGTIVEGGNPVYDINVSNNSFTDPWKGGANAWVYIATNVAAGTSTNNTIPGDYNSTTGEFVFPWDYTQTDITIASNSLPRGFNFSITNNTFCRTRSAVSAFSQYGYGTRLNNGVSSDPAFTNADLTILSAIDISGQIENFIISNNTIKDTSFGIRLTPYTEPSSYDNPARYIKNGNISNNSIFNTIRAGIFFNCQSDTDQINIDVICSNNTINCDPYRMALLSNLDGTYDSDGDPSGISLQWSRGVSIINNKFKNCNNTIQSFRLSENIILNNIAHCGVPVSSGFNIGNTGIGNIIRNYGFRYFIENSNPTSAAYLNFISQTLETASSIPSSGWYYSGWFVKNTTPSLDANNMVITGWIRLTTGTGHVSGTDWAVARVSNVSPAT
jgi:hypothetical protein